MAYLAYYREERIRHADLRGTPIDFRFARRVTRLLAYEYGVPLTKVERTSGRRHAHFNPMKARIRYNTDWLNWLTVIHEFAHALDWKLNPPPPGVRYVRGRRWHGNVHKELVNDLARIVKERGWLTRPPPVAPWMLNRAPGAPLVPARVD